MPNLFGSSSNSGQQVSTTMPAFGVNKLKGIMNDAKGLYDKGKGFKAYPDQAWVDFSPETQQALRQMGGIAQQGNQIAPGAMDFTKGLISGDYNINQSGLASLLGHNPNAIQTNAGGVASGQQGINVNPQLQALLGQNADALQQNATGIASGAKSIAGSINPQLQALMGQAPNAIGRNAAGIASGVDNIGTEGDYRALLDAQDADFENVVGKTANTLGDQISRQFGGSSFGSPEHSGTIANQVGDVVSRMRSDNFAQNQARKQGLLGDITGVQGSNLATRLGASTALSGEQGAALAAQSGLLGQMGGFNAQDIANQISAAGALSGEQMGNRSQQAGVLGQMGDFQSQNIGNRLNAAGMLSGEQQNAFNNTRGLYGDMANLSQQDINNRLAGLGMADSVYNSQYLPSQILANIGAAREGKSAEELQAKMDAFNIKQMAPWDRLQQYFGIASGTGAQGNRTVTNVSQPSNPLSSILGGGLLASQLFL